MAAGVSSRHDLQMLRGFLDDNGGESIKLVGQKGGGRRRGRSSTATCIASAQLMLCPVGSPTRAADPLLSPHAGGTW